MDIAGWNARYQSPERAAEDLRAAVNPLLVRVVKTLTPGRVLDLACGTGRNALWLAHHGWQVTAVDGAENAITLLEEIAVARGLHVRTVVADLASPGFHIENEAWDLIVILFYLQRNLLEQAKKGLKPGGTLITIAHTVEGDEPPTAHRLASGELEQYFSGWPILHHREGDSQDCAHKRAVAELVVRKPETWA